MKGYKLLMILVVALWGFSISPLYAQPDKIVFDPSKIFGKSKRPGVILPHNLHVEAGLSCKDCHHVYENGKNVLDEGKLEEGNQGIRCSACHGPKLRIDLEQAFHDQCIGCHITSQKEKKKTGPRFCGQCHVKK
jgi:hypothetical protein